MYHNLMEISGKTALITGAAKRIGREIALALAKKGANLVIHYRSSKAEAEATAKELRANGTKVTLIQGDLSKTDDIHEMVTQIDKTCPTVDILVNSASAFYRTPIQDVRESDWDLFMTTNAKGPFFLSQAIGSRMSKGSGGKIINIADWSGIRPYKDHAPYCASKGALITLTKSLARDLAPKVWANAIAPGPILHPPDMPQSDVDAIARMTALGRWGSPKDIANAVVFLVENDFINGTVLVVDGGRSII